MFYNFLFSTIFLVLISSQREQIKTLISWNNFNAKKFFRQQF